jgi:hypothetical protein
MKKMFFIAFFAICGLGTANAQDGGNQTSKGNWVIEANTGAATTGNTMFSLASSNGTTTWSLGFDGGYFISDNFAIKGGLGYADLGLLDGLNYKIGAEYYLNGTFPVSVDFTGSSMTEMNWLGLQAGYAWFLSDHVSVKPALRYNLGLDDQDGLFQAVIGFALYF